MNHFEHFPPPTISELHQRTTHLDQLTTREVEWMKENSPWTALFPLGSVEPHGPHLPLATDRYLSEENARRALDTLRQDGINAWIVPAIAYGVTDFAHGFDGAISLPQDLYEVLLTRIITHYIQAGCRHICLINHHLEPGQLNALQTVFKTIQAQFTRGQISFPKVVSKRWGQHLGAEFKSGACHAGEYEGSMIARSHPHTFQEEIANRLPQVEISLSQAIQSGCNGFLEAGMDLAYTGHPQTISIAEGERLYKAHAHMVCTEIKEALRLLDENPF